MLQIIQTASWMTFAAAAVLIVLVAMGYLDTFRATHPVRQRKSRGAFPPPMPAGVRGFFDMQHPSLDMLGFTFVGNARIHNASGRIYGRYYAGPDSRAWAEVLVGRTNEPVAAGFAGLEGISLITMFADGLVLQTSTPSVAPGEQAAPRQPRVCRARLYDSLRELYEDHMRALERYEADYSTTAQHYPPQEIARISMLYTAERWPPTETDDQLAGSTDRWPNRLGNSKGPPPRPTADDIVRRTTLGPDDTALLRATGLGH